MDEDGYLGFDGEGMLYAARPRTMQNRRRQGLIHRSFMFGVYVKALDGLLETVAGTLLVFLRPDQLRTFVRAFALHELGEDRHDVIASYLLHAARHFSAREETFGAIYLLGHGVVKMALVVGLLRRKRWAYPTAIGVFFLYVIYQLYRYTHTQSLWLPVLSAFDVLVIALSWLEYRRLRSAHAFSDRR